MLIFILIFVFGLAVIISIAPVSGPALFEDYPPGGPSEPTVRLAKQTVTARHRPRPNQHDPPTELIYPQIEGIFFCLKSNFRILYNSIH